MAVKDIRSNLKETVAFSEVISSDGVNNPANAGIIDTADFELGLMFSVAIPVYGDGNYTLLLEESSDSLMAGAVAITGDKLIGTLPVLSAVTAEGATLETVGVISNLRYVRASITSASSTTATTVVVTATQKAENMPV